MKIQGNLLVEKLVNLVLDAHKLREVTLNHKKTIHKVVDGLIDKLALLQVVIDMKTNVAIT